MGVALKTCRVCGKSYEACRTSRRIPGVFRWQDVSCSPECGNIYLTRIRESRSHSASTIVEENTGVQEAILVDVSIDNEEYEDDYDNDNLLDELDYYFDCQDEKDI